VTVLFADMRGSLSLIQGVDPEEVQMLLDAVLAAMIDAVHRYEGAVVQTMGDGILALFGAPIAYEDHATRACCAATAMQAAMRRLHDETWKARGAEPSIRVGLHSGEVALRAVHGDLSVEYRAVGSTTHIASRMEQLAEPGAVWLTDQTLRLCRGLLRTRAIGPVQVKGVLEPIQAFELTGISTRTRFQANALRGLSPLVGRESALQRLTGALDAALAGEPRVAVLRGEPGIGKSRLSYELIHRAGERCRVLEAAATSYGQRTPHSVLASLARVLLCIDDDDDIERLKDKAGTRLDELGVSHSPHLSALLELLDVSSGDAAWARLDPVQRRRSIEHTVQTLLSTYCGRGPAIVLFEDLHWCDEESLAFIAKLIAAPPVSHTLLLLTHRPGLRLQLAELPSVLTCEVVALEPGDVHALLVSLLGAHGSSAELRMRLASRTVGNPFFIEESARSVLDAGLECIEEANATIDVPESIDALLGARVDRLPEELREILQAAAVIGDDASLELLREVAAVPEQTFNAGLSALTHLDLLYEMVPLAPLATEGGTPTRLFCFKHALIQEVVYKRLVRARKRVLHARVVDAFETLFPARLNEHVVRLAEHAQRAELWDKCALYHTRACIRAASRSSNSEAIAHVELGLEAAQHLPRGAERDRLCIDLRLTALAPLLPMGAHERVIQLLLEAEALARGLGDQRRLAKVSSQLSAEFWVTARYEAGRRQVENSLLLAQSLTGDRFALEASARYNMAMIHHACGEYPAALVILRDLAGVFTGDAARKRLGWAGYPSVLTRTFIISVQSMAGGFAEAEQAFDVGHRLADEFEHAFSRTMILEQFGMCLLAQGEGQRALQVLRQALAICDRDEVGTMRTPILSHLGQALLQVGEVAEAAEVIAWAGDVPAELVGHYALHYRGIARAQLALARQELRQAERLAQAALEDARQHGERGFSVRALLQYADVVAADPGRAQAAHQLYRDALAQARALEMQPSVAQAHTGIAITAHTFGDPGLAQESQARARNVWQQLGALRRVADLERLKLTGRS
jgi:class 3 adenylate cyclase/tetratricopeptide (TPR) repeat protein